MSAGMTVASDVDCYIAAIPAPRRAKAKRLRALIRATVPAAAESMQYRMPTYDLGGSVVAFANQKRYVSLYFCGAAMIANVKVKHPALKCGKGCINVADKDAPPEGDIVRSLEKAATFNNARR
jgi:uncharacterized protein YdhG (YjbR/CyaY superfamily)